MVKTIRNTGTVIVGAGFAGLSAALHLARAGERGIVVIEREKKLGVHASGNNAGMIRQAIADPVIAGLAHRGRLALARAARNGWKDISYRESGSLLTAKGAAVGELRRIASVLKKNRLSFRFLSSGEASSRFPVLENADFHKGLLCPSDASLDIEALMRGFVKHLKSEGVVILYGHAVKAIRAKKDGYELDAGDLSLRARRVVNCAGAWAGPLGEMAGASGIPFKAYRRHLFFSRPVKSVPKSSPFIWDLSHEVYFRPYGGRLMASPCDKHLFEPKKGLAGRGKNDPRMKAVLLKKLRSFAPTLSSVRPDSSRVGLRTMAPDGRFVVGEDPKLKNFFWVAGLGGHGVTTSFSVGRLAADLILGRKEDKRLTKALSPGRFTAK